MSFLHPSGQFLSMRRFLLSTLLTASLFTGLLIGLLPSSPAGASSKIGYLKGVIFQCGPGPIVYNPASPPKPKAVTVVVLHHGRTYVSEFIHFPVKQPWDGAFSFSLPPGTYQVVSSYSGPEVTARVISGKVTPVNFGVIACAD